jgi:hypothetical protein
LAIYLSKRGAQVLSGPPPLRVSLHLSTKVRGKHPGAAGPGSRAFPTPDGRERLDPSHTTTSSVVTAPSPTHAPDSGRCLTGACGVQWRHCTQQWHCCTHLAPPRRWCSGRVQRRVQRRVRGGCRTGVARVTTRERRDYSASACFIVRSAGTWRVDSLVNPRSCERKEG